MRCVMRGQEQSTLHLGGRRVIAEPVIVTLQHLRCLLIHHQLPLHLALFEAVHPQ